MVIHYHYKVTLLYRNYSKLDGFGCIFQVVYQSSSKQPKQSTPSSPPLLPPHEIIRNPNKFEQLKVNEAKQDVERVTNKQRTNHWSSEQLKILPATQQQHQASQTKCKRTTFRYQRTLALSIKLNSKRTNGLFTSKYYTLLIRLCEAFRWLTLLFIPFICLRSI